MILRLVFNDFKSNKVIFYSLFEYYKKSYESVVVQYVRDEVVTRVNVLENAEWDDATLVTPSFQAELLNLLKLTANTISYEVGKTEKLLAPSIISSLSDAFHPRTLITYQCTLA